MTGLIGVVFWSALALVPIATALFLASLFRRRDRLAALAPLAAVVGFFVGGVVGWALVPHVWTASFWTTVEAAGDSAKYGDAFENNAEHALMYCFVPAVLGAVVAGLGALVALWLVAVPPSAKPSRQAG